MTSRSSKPAFAAALALAATLAVPARASAPASRARVLVLDDGEKIPRDRARPLDAGPWTAGPVDLFALRGETLALQVVIEAGDAPVDDVRALVEPFVADDGARLAVDTETFVERFVVIERPSGNDRDPGSLAFTARSAPSPALLGAVADALVPEALERAHAAPHERAALWLDLTVPDAARPGAYRSVLLVRDARGELEARPLELRVLDARLPFAAAPAFVYYDTSELRRRMGDAGAERDLRALLHAHHLAAIHDVNAKTQLDAAAIELDRAAVLGTAYARGRGYRGPGDGVGEGVLALGAYGSLGEPSPQGRDVAAGLARAILGDGAGETAAFLYSNDEDCSSEWPARWVELLRGSAPLRGVRVGASCGDEPSAQAADLVMQTAPAFDPARARAAERAGKWVWAYNGVRPSAGPLMLDVPATDLRANAWIAMRYGVPRWFYWEATFWFDNNRGGRGGERGFDPYVVAETFHNADGDHANGDGLLVYPGTQRAPGMVDYGVPRVFPSVRLQNLRRGIEDAGYIALARAIDRARADAVVRRMVPRALAWAGDRPSWPERAQPWLDARRELAEIIATPVGVPAAGEAVSESCSIATSSVRAPSAPPWVALFFLGGMTFAVRALSSTKRAPIPHGHELPQARRTPADDEAQSSSRRRPREPSASDARGGAQALRGADAPPSAAEAVVHALEEHPHGAPAVGHGRRSGRRPLARPALRRRRLKR